MSEKKAYRPAEYWQNRLSKDFTLSGVGYQRFGRFYNHWLYRQKGEVHARALADVAVKGRRVLDIGCGTGFFVRWFHERGAHVDGVDITQASVDQLSKQFPGKFRRLDLATESLVVDAPYDIVNMWDVMYHIVDPAGYRMAMRNIAGALAPGGIFLLTDQFGASEDRQMAAHVVKRCMATYREMAKELGLELAKHLPLYHMLNRPINRWDNVLAPAYYWNDRRKAAILNDNLSLAVWRKKQS